MEEFECILIFSGAMMAGAFFVTTLFCHYRRQQPVPFSTFLTSACIPTPLTIIAGTLCVEPREIFAASHWEFDWLHIRFWLALWLWGLFISFFTSLFVVIFYRRWSKADEKHVA
jgi:hypothetical protein